METERQSSIKIADLSVTLSSLPRTTEISLHIHPDYLFPQRIEPEAQTTPEKTIKLIELIRFNNPNPQITNLSVENTRSYDIYLDNKIALTLTYKTQ
jgi:hypothetical protein